MQRAEEILAFWFGELTDVYDTGQNAKMWWQKSDELDGRIRDRFGPDLERAAQGALDDWLETPRSTLALVILLDQFSRNVFRNDPRSFAQDERARAAVMTALERGHDHQLRMVERQFLLMPLMHSEDIAAHERLARYIDAFVASIPEDKRQAFESLRTFAKKHADIIQRFGRYPHRNAVLGRTSTAEEEEFLKQPGSSF